MEKKENNKTKRLKDLFNISDEEVSKIIDSTKQVLVYDLMTKKRKDLAYERASKILEDTFIKDVKLFLSLNQFQINHLKKDTILKFLEISEIFINQIPEKFFNRKKETINYDKRFSPLLQIYQSLRSKHEQLN